MVTKEIEIRWNDLDKLGHVNNAVYLTYLEEVRDEWLRSVVGHLRDIEDYVLARVSIDYRGELKLDDDIAIASCLHARTGQASVATREEVRAADGRLVAQAESVLVAWTRDSRRPRPLTEDERRAFYEAGNGA